MVGVPGKYKGCNTCRLRRVKCDNTRPFCRKCIDGGRQCGGYERETVFIIGTIQDGGRCSSHPPRVVKSSKKGKRSPTKVEDDEGLDILTLEPLQPAWDDLVPVSNAGTRYYLQISALHTVLHLVARSGDDSSSSKTSLVQFPPYEPFNIRAAMNQGDFQLKAQCLIHLAPVEESQRDSPESSITTESICLFLYEHNWSLIFTDQAPWKEATAESNTVRRLGPGNFQTFPNHHFFVRLFRHNAICAALLNRKSTFLSRPEWLTTPWELHPKSSFDKLLDSLVLLPSLLSRADRLLPGDPTLARRLQAQDLLGNCLSLERLFDQWHSTAKLSSTSPPSQVYWAEDAEGSDAQIPFAHALAFSDGVTALTFIYYWSGLILFYPCIQRLYDAIFQPVVDSFSGVLYPSSSSSSAAAAAAASSSSSSSLSLPSLPAAGGLQAGGGGGEHLKYCCKEVREMAANVCRSLDFALAATAQPDTLLFPLLVVQDFYRDIGLETGDGQLETMWCEAFRLRLAGKGQEMADVVRSRRWYDMAQY